MSEYIYALRLTPYPNNAEKDNVFKTIIPKFMTAILSEWYVGGRETSINIHYHIVFQTKEPVDKKVFKELLYEMFVVPDDKRGNTSFSLVEARDKQKACSYAVKDGEFFFSPGARTLAESSYKVSKKKKQSTKSLMADLQSRFNKGELNERSLWIELCKGRAYLGIPHSNQTTNAIVETMKINKNPDERATELWEKNNIKLN